ncbi:hypothetical protein KF282_0228 [Lactococcus lactis subsp. lactis]|uniref:Uncharacterized protein n=1 Tax=Lactococcus lactis subsp. lactis TaxID=1360 RepID=A0A0V8D3Q0_LACLL|nr:hypothetical protein KF282_0228 [Lactococcus lactis subsp. lactis]
MTCFNSPIFKIVSILKRLQKEKILVKFIVSKFASQNFFVSLFYRISCQI